MGENDVTRIPVDKALREELKSRKRGDDTYNDVIRRLLDGDGDGSEEVEYHTPEHVAEYVAEQFDYTAIAGMTADEVVERLRSEMG